MKKKLGRARCGFVKFRFVKAAVLAQFDPCHGGAEPHFEVAPATGVLQRLAHTPDRISKKPNGGHAGQRLAAAKKETGMQVADDGLFDLRQFLANDFLLPEKWQCRRVM